MEKSKIIKLIRAFSATEDCCDNCPAYNECEKGKICEETIYNWLTKEDKK